MKIFRLLLFSLISASSIYGQTIEDLEYDLSWFYSSEKYGDRVENAWQLQKIDPLNEIAAEYICRYYYDREIDSVSIFLDNLVADFPDRPETYILCYDLFGYENKDLSLSERTLWKVSYLRKALQLDSTNKTALYFLAGTFYGDFLYPIEEIKYHKSLFDFSSFRLDSYASVRKPELKISAFEHPADSSLKYFYRLWLFYEDLRDVIYFPIKQLECYLEKQPPIPKDEDLFQTSSICHFPTWHFANLSENWETALYDYLYELESSKRTAELFSQQLSDLKEPCLYSQKVNEGFESYRFLWLRSFHNPIAIRIEKQQNEISLYWKVGKGAGGYAPEGIKKQGKRILKETDWNKFIQLISLTNFDSLPNQHLYLPESDGAAWTIEKKNRDSFKAHYTIYPGKEFKDCCLFLLKLSKIKVKEDDIY